MACADMLPIRLFAGPRGVSTVPPGLCGVLDLAPTLNHPSEQARRGAPVSAGLFCIAPAGAVE
jgi:hypothetical protein